MIAIDVNEDIRYVLRRERELPKEEQTVFILRVLPATEAAALEDSMASVALPTQTMTMSNAKVALEVLKKGLKGWENVKDRNGNLIDFRANHKGQPTDGILNMIPPRDRRELADVITTANMLQEDDVKNSSSPSPSLTD